MKKIIITLILLFVYFFLFSNTEWNLIVNSYTGGRVYLEQNFLNDMSYFPKNIVEFNLNFTDYDNFKLDTTIKNGKEITKDIPILYKLSANYSTKGYEFGFLKDNLGYGKNSYIFSFFILSPYFDKFFFGNYNFYGFNISKNLKNISTSLKIGGNQFNREIFDYNLTYHTKQKNYLKIFFMRVVKDNYYNTNLYSLGTELSTRKNFFTINAFANLDYYKRINNETNVFYYNYYAEIILKISKQISLGNNFNAKSITTGNNSDCTDYLFLSAKLKNSSFRIILKKSKTDKNQSEKSLTTAFDRKYKKLTFQIITSYGKSFENRDFVELGFNIHLNYEKN